MRRVPALDGLRAVAVLIVFASHAMVPGFNAGGLAVDIFFVLSGFLITGILLDRPTNLPAFYLSRVRRLTPPLLILLAVVMVWGLVPASHVAVAAGYGMDYGRAFFLEHSSITHTWSLSVEEHFYLFWPFVVVVMKKLPARVWLPSLALAYVAATGWRDLNALWFGYDATYFRFDTRLSGLILGALVAVLMRQETKREAWTFGATGAALLLSGAFTLLSHESLRGLILGVTIAETASALVILSIMTGGASSLTRLLSARVMVFIGQISYGLYLFHYPLTNAMENFDWWVIVIVALPLSVAGAALSFFLIERPIMESGHVRQSLPLRHTS